MVVIVTASFVGFSTLLLLVVGYWNRSGDQPAIVPFSKRGQR